MWVSNVLFLALFVCLCLYSSPFLSFLLCIRAIFHTSIHLHDPLLWGTTFWSCLSGPPENQSSLTAQTGFADRRRAKVEKQSKVTVCVQAFQYVRINKLLLPYCKKNLYLLWLNVWSNFATLGLIISCLCESCVKIYYRANKLGRWLLGGFCFVFKCFSCTESSSNQLADD